MKKLIGPIFSRIIEHNECQWTTYKGPQCFSTSMVQSIWSFLVGPKKSRTKFFKNKSIVPKKKRFWHNFSPITDYDRHWVIFCYAPQGILAIMVEVMRSFLWELKRLFKTHIFRKNAIFSVKKCFCPVCFWIVEPKKPQETFYKIQKDILQLI